MKLEGNIIIELNTQELDVMKDGKPTGDKIKKLSLLAVGY